MQKKENIHNNKKITCRSPSFPRSLFSLETRLQKGELWAMGISQGRLNLIFALVVNWPTDKKLGLGILFCSPKPDENRRRKTGRLTVIYISSSSPSYLSKPVRFSSRPSRSIHFGDVTKTNAFSLGKRDPKRIDGDERQRKV